MGQIGNVLWDLDQFNGGMFSRPDDRYHLRSSKPYANIVLDTNVRNAFSLKNADDADLLATFASAMESFSHFRGRSGKKKRSDERPITHGKPSLMHGNKPLIHG